VKLCDILGPGTHGTTFGGTPLGCAVALRILEVIERDRLADNVRQTGEYLRSAIGELAHRHPGVVKGARGLGFMLGIELGEASQVRAFAAADKAPSLVFVNRLHEAGVLTIPSGNQIVRLLPALNLPRSQAEEGMAIIERVVASLA
jgi:acetylornithine/succinyldiaminopimelate/putrescine aminotransferase